LPNYDDIADDNVLPTYDELHEQLINKYVDMINNGEGEPDNMEEDLAYIGDINLGHEQAISIWNTFITYECYSLYDYKFSNWNIEDFDCPKDAIRYALEHYDE
jgi:hypothetical protein